MGGQLNHHSQAASRKTVTARAKPGPVVSCHPLWYIARAANDSRPVCAKSSRPIADRARPAQSQGHPHCSLLPRSFMRGLTMTRK